MKITKKMLESAATEKIISKGLVSLPLSTRDFLAEKNIVKLGIPSHVS